MKNPLQACLLFLWCCGTSVDTNNITNSNTFDGDIQYYSSHERHIDNKCYIAVYGKNSTTFMQIPCAQSSGKNPVSDPPENDSKELPKEIADILQLHPIIIINPPSPYKNDIDTCEKQK